MQFIGALQNANCMAKVLNFQVRLLSLLIVVLDISQCYAVGLYMSDMPAKLSSDLFVLDSKIHCIRSSNTMNLCV
jgi:hypothetical protein